MLAQQELVTLLKTLAFSKNLSFDDTLFEKMASIFLKNQDKRPLPNVERLQESTKFADLLTAILQKVSDKRTQLKLASLNFNLEELLENYYTSPKDTRDNSIVQRIAVLSDVFSSSIKAQLCSFETDNTILAERVKKIDERIQPVDAILEKTFRSAIESHQKELMRIALTLHSEQYRIDDKNKEGPVHIIHFYPDFPRASEYLHAYNSDDEDDDAIEFDQTSHGLGAAVYGRGNLTEKEIEVQVNDLQYYEIVTLEKPLHLDDDSENESNELTALSKHLQLITDTAKTLQVQSRKNKIERSEALQQALLTVDTSENLSENTKTFAEILKKKAIQLQQFHALKNSSLTSETLYDLLLKSLTNFLEDSRKSHKMGKGRYLKTTDLVPMPINYVIEELGFDGIVSKFNDSFQRGLVAMDHNFLSKPVINPGKETALKLNHNQLIRLIVKKISQAKKKSEELIEDVFLTTTPLPLIPKGGVGSLLIKPSSLFSLTFFQQPLAIHEGKSSEADETRKLFKNLPFTSKEGRP